MINRSLTYQPQPQCAFLSIILKKPAFFIDEYIEGNIELNLRNQTVINDIYITFNLSEFWNSINDEKTPIGDLNKECLMTMYLEVKKKLKINTDLVSLVPGKFTFPFYFKIPRIVPACFEYPTKESNASLRYTLSAQIISPYMTGTATNYVLLQSRPIMLNKELFFTTSTNLHKWGLFNGGSATLNISILNGTDSFKNGETLNLNIEVDNTKGKLNSEECKLTFNRTLVLKSKYGKVVKEIKNECNRQVIKTVTNINEKKSFSGAITLKETNTKMFDFNGKLPYTNISDISYFLPSMNSLLIECKYHIKATLYFNRFVKYNERPRIIIPINVSHQSPNEYNNEIQYYRNQNQINNSQINNNQYNNSQIYNNNTQYNNNNQYNNSQYNLIDKPQNTFNNNDSLINNNPQFPLKDENQNNENDELDLPSREEIEKPFHGDEQKDLGAPTFGAPTPVFQNNINNNIGNINEIK